MAQRDAILRLIASAGSQSALARRSGVSQGRISEYATGKRAISVAQLSRLARAVGLEVELRLRPFDVGDPGRPRKLTDVERREVIADLLELGDQVVAQRGRRRRALAPTFPELVARR